MKSIVSWLAATAVVLAGFGAQTASAEPQDCTPVSYLDRPVVGAGFSASVSHHTVGGPVLADDFVPAATGRIHCIDWWGTRAQSDQWELTLHLGNFGAAPLAVPPVTGGFKLFATALGDDSNGDGIFWYHVKIDDPDWMVLAGQHYWFSAANLLDGWHWALADGIPEVGNQFFAGVQSVGAQPCPDGGPHCGPWAPQGLQAPEQYAFMLQVPEPGGAALFAVALLAAGLARRRSVRRS